MSLGERVDVADPISVCYETAAQNALAAGTLLIAAAGNDSFRPGVVVPVHKPANCPSIMAVGAVDPSMLVASFTASGLVAGGGEVDLAAPGVNIYSSWRTTLNPPYLRRNGTSEATPFAAAIAALYVQAQGVTAMALWNRLTATALALPLPVADVGAGLVQAP
jgi:subtilisin family serine protease